MVKIRYTVFRTTPGYSCGHSYQTKSAATKCIKKLQEKMGKQGGWHIGSAKYSH